MKVVLNYDPSTGQIFDRNGAFLFTWMGLNYDPYEGGSAGGISGDQLIRIMKMAAYSAEPDKVASL